MDPAAAGATLNCRCQAYQSQPHLRLFRCHIRPDVHASTRFWDCGSRRHDTVHEYQSPE